MKNSEKIILKMRENNGVITSNHIKQMGIDKKVIARLLADKQIERAEKGIYILPETIGDEYFNKTYGKNAIYSHMTALYFHNLCNRVPMIYDITVTKKYYGVLDNDQKVLLHKVDKELLNLGKMKIKSPQGQDIDVYDIERCLCDCLKDKNTIASEYIKEAFNIYFKEMKKDTFKIMKYAKKLRIEKEMHDYLEVLL